ncbi:type II toxin-antitoxin system RelE/ParE family toxin [Breoghania sp. L-A4]|uniref:type II toxin-antitoxin system RelE/ParE family toxin n=1 Tax=Breoghania sp. L-A4 TaxID=2304600 RepID=UPI000E35BA24|nr:type II toxin-antitoxin system RelE/ParE family toxin [Breoghania sp. L-A4]AXS41277.1 type II toxin-antitoxin system RelE/ParE family toxin [Breoghania sp. L-A4]
MIRSYKGKMVLAVAVGRAAKGFPTDLVKPAIRKLTMIEYAAALGDLRSPPGNRLEKLSGDRVGQYSIRINDQWRICFVWTDGGAEEVEIVDYH